jgi:predicted PurR-regulated permease PerM
MRKITHSGATRWKLQSREMDAPPKPPAPDSKTVRIEVAPMTIAWIIAAVAGLWLLYKLWIVVLLLVNALVLVGMFNPVIEWMEARKVKRMHALFLLVLALSLGSALAIFLTVPSMIDQTTTIIQELPGQRLKLIAILGKHTLTSPLARTMKESNNDQVLARLQTHAVGYWSGAIAAIGYGVTTFFLAFYLLGDGKRTQGALYALVPRDYHMRLARIIHNLEEIVGGYMRGQLITSAALAAFVFLLLTACKVPNALALALFAAIVDVLPFVGGLMAAIPVVLTALGQGQTTGLVVMILMFIYQEFENKVLVPKVYGKALRLSPAAVVLALIAGGLLLGMMGALLALPIAAGLQMIIEELGVEMPGDDSDDPTARARDKETEAAYTLMSAGATAPEAGQIANDLAHDIRAADAWVAASQAKDKAS